ncbi:proteasome assembly chaperone family protein [Natronosalvus halobius]|uniref:proteasome assembly chaperone family protein n=1 Tax=Natronosalvus halobius TaxID=2953746 RepID=UPI0020A00BAD|nr:PAC2 family protein [Natronosalvus halobius]USZ71410.1 PAC2 family protein [Natronosalvus halobius]
MPSEPSFKVTSSADVSPSETLVIGVSTVGLAGLTAVDHLIKNNNSTEYGHILTRNIPDITPFEEGEPRLPLRLYDLPDLDLSILVGELFIPTWAADSFVEALLEWTSSAGIGEITVLHGVPFPHGPDEHDVFYVASTPYRTKQLEDTEIKPLKGGYLDGIASELITSNLTGKAPPTGALITPTHPPGPDFDSALLFLEALQRIYEFTIDEEELRHRADEVKQYYQELANQMERFGSGERPSGGYEFPEDRMFM